jgi:hypothetical protein
VVTLPVGPVNVPARVVAEVRGFPTVASGQPTVIVDLARLGDVLAARSQPPLPVTQWWLRTGSGIPAGLPPGAGVTTRAGLAAALLADPLPNVQQLGSLVIVIAAVPVAAAATTAGYRPDPAAQLRTGESA